ncbi:hypothetical protein [Planctomicrobium sp. SH527]|uniref:hypothetical protein n=1 Tax=Planctomicrobium sp. SH527 TaxID=3448123 RepID=UPI003F5C3CFA
MDKFRDIVALGLGEPACLAFAAADDWPVVAIDDDAKVLGAIAIKPEVPRSVKYVCNSFRCDVADRLREAVAIDCVVKTLVIETTGWQADEVAYFVRVPVAEVGRVTQR